MKGLKTKLETANILHILKQRRDLILIHNFIYSLEVVKTSANIYRTC